MLKIYTRNTCQYCSSAKAVLTNKGITYEEVNVDKDPTAREWLMEIGETDVSE